MPNTPSGRSNSVSSGNETKREKMKGKNKKKLWQASKHFAPSFPRQSASSHTVQRSRHGRGEFVAALESASDNAMPGYYSVYSFPRGHSSDGFIPDVDCIFIDLDIIGDSYNPKRGLTDIADWRREMSALLARSRMIAQSLLDDGQTHSSALRCRATRGFTSTLISRRYPPRMARSNSSSPG